MRQLSGIFIIPTDAGVRSFTYNLKLNHVDEPGSQGNFLAGDNYDGVIKGFVRVNGDEIEKLFVEPAFHGRGIGGALLSYAVETLGGKRLLVLEKNKSAIRFYERYGFHLTEQKQRMDDTPEFLVRMER